MCDSCSGHHTSCNRSGKFGRRDRIRSASLSRKPLLINSKDPNAEVTIFSSTEKQVSKDWWAPATAVVLFIWFLFNTERHWHSGDWGWWGGELYPILDCLDLNYLHSDGHFYVSLLFFGTKLLDIVHKRRVLRRRVIPGRLGSECVCLPVRCSTIYSNWLAAVKEKNRTINETFKKRCDICLL